ncbi:hypothetical protein [Bartonella vinsonii]|uniref:hypothetical protein n=1 Tax=Bartonella vinsonii TaxID=33047 RepID=UPI000F826D31|nr:hypothetical protein [Bartonella vinsonii]
MRRIPLKQAILLNWNYSQAHVLWGLERHGAALSCGKNPAFVIREKLNFWFSATATGTLVQ